VNFTRVVYADSKAARFVAGTAFHWSVLISRFVGAPQRGRYAISNRYSGDEFDHLDQVHALKPDKFMLATEACLCPPGLGDWSVVCRLSVWVCSAHLPDLLIEGAAARPMPMTSLAT